MTSLADLPELVGFFSYSREDDQDSRNALSMIRTLIQNELRARMGRSRQSLRLWQDQEAIAPGSMWESQINLAVQQSVFFIPIITPRVINSKYCGIEFNRFLDRERQLGRDDLLFPILYIDVDELQDEKKWRGHPILEVIGQRQYVDWREYRYEQDSAALRRATANLCAQIVTTLRRPQPNGRTDAASSEEAQSEADRATLAHAERASPPKDESVLAPLDEESTREPVEELLPLLKPDGSLPEDDNLKPRSGRYGVAQKAAAVALVLMSTVLAIVAYFLLRPDPAAVQACIGYGGSGGTCPHGATSVAVPFLILLGGLGGARKVWRG